MPRDGFEDPRPDKLLRVMRTLESMRSQLDKHVHTLDNLAFLVESVHDELAPKRTRRRTPRDARRDALKNEAARRGAESFAARRSAGQVEIRFNDDAWIPLRSAESKLVLALARGPRGGDDGYGVFLLYDDVAREVGPRLTRRALVQRVYRLRNVLLETDAANPFWVETLDGVGLRLKVRNAPTLHA